jgi:hypothetical protein
LNARSAIIAGEPTLALRPDRPDRPYGALLSFVAARAYFRLCTTGRKKLVDANEAAGANADKNFVCICGKVNVAGCAPAWKVSTYRAVEICHGI